MQVILDSSFARSRSAPIWKKGEFRDWTSAHATHWSRACHIIFTRAQRVENSTKYRTDDLCVNLVCEYFYWMLGDPHFFFGRSLPFLTLSIILKNKKNLSVGSFNYFSYTIKNRIELVHGYRCA